MRRRGWSHRLRSRRTRGGAALASAGSGRGISHWRSCRHSRLRGPAAAGTAAARFVSRSPRRRTRRPKDARDDLGRRARARRSAGRDRPVAPVARTVQVHARVGRRSPARTVTTGSCVPTGSSRRTAAGTSSSGDRRSRRIHQRVHALVTLNSPTGNPTAGEPVAFSGAVTPSHAGEHVRLELLGASGWHADRDAPARLGTPASRPTTRSRRPGTCRLRAVLPADARNIRSTSMPLTVTVAPGLPGSTRSSTS